jgi:hypothetical protein
MLTAGDTKDAKGPPSPPLRQSNSPTPATHTPSSQPNTGDNGFLFAFALPCEIKVLDPPWLAAWLKDRNESLIIVRIGGAGYSTNGYKNHFDEAISCLAASTESTTGRENQSHTLEVPHTNDESGGSSTIKQLVSSISDQHTRWRHLMFLAYRSIQKKDRCLLRATQRLGGLFLVRLSRFFIIYVCIFLCFSIFVAWV